MFVLFVNLYLAMFTGSWQGLSWSQLVSYFHVKDNFNAIGTFITSIFNDTTTMDTLGTELFNDNINFSFINVVSIVLALITSIGIVVVATKGIKKIFTVFFYGVR